jgi:hypothetical protein
MKEIKWKLPREKEITELLAYLLKSKCTSCISSDISTSTIAWGRVCRITKTVIWPDIMYRRQNCRMRLKDKEFKVIYLDKYEWQGHST